jgi:hypothetical protein
MAKPFEWPIPGRVRDQRGRRSGFGLELLWRE